MRVAAMRLSCAALCAVVLAGLTPGGPAVAADRSAAADAIAEKFARAAAKAERAEAEKKKEAQTERARAAAAADAARRRAAEQRAADEAEMLARARAEAQARHAKERAKAAERARIEAERKAARKEAARLAREAQARKRAAEARAEAARRLEAERLAREVEEKRLAEERRKAGEAKRAEAARVAREAEEKRRADAARRALEARRLEEARRIAEKFRLAREARERERARTLGTRNSLGGPLPPAPWDEALERAPGERTHSRQAASWPARVTVLLMLAPKRKAFGGWRKPHPILCVNNGCYVSGGADDGADRMPRWQALGPGNTLGRRAGPCRNQLTCVFRSVTLTSASAWIQPVSMGFWHHDRRDIRTAHPDGSCEVVLRRIYCAQPIIAHGYRAWIVPEYIAEKAGPDALEEALEDGLPRARSAGGDTWTANVHALPTR